jgi:MraZ protein
MSTANTVLYTGNFRHNLDDKGRLTIPSAWRTAHGEADAFLAIPNPGGYISVLPPAEVLKLTAKIAEVPMADLEAQAEIQNFFALAQNFTFDKQGRVSLTEELLAHAGITGRETMLGGALTKFGIFSPERWDKLRNQPGAANPSAFLSRYKI